MTTAEKQKLSLAVRVLLVVLGVTILVIVYLFQRTGFFVLSGQDFGPNTVFILNRYIRLTLNDIACLLVIYAFFREGNYIKLAFWVFLLEFFIFLPLYLTIKLNLEGPSEISSPLLSQVHRLFVNPMLMILLMGGFLYQKHVIKK